MEAIATCIEGLEFITQLEIKELLNKKSEIITSSRVKFTAKDEKQILEFIFNSRSAIKIYRLIEKIEFSDLKNLLHKIEKSNFPKIKNSFVVRCERIGEHDFQSLDVEKSVGEIILKKNKKLKVELKNPKTIIILDIINNTCILGIDYIETKLSRRDYRIRLSANPLNPCLAYSMLRIAKIKEKETILDPLCKSGEIPIEAALYLQNIPPNKRIIENELIKKEINHKLKAITKNKKAKIYAIDSSQNNLKSAQLNAKIVNINKSIIFSRYDLEWLDTKLDKNSIKKIITSPPYQTNNFPKEKIEIVYKELFYQLEFILKPNGTITILAPTSELIEKYAKQHKFKKIEDYKIIYNKQEFHILNFKK